MSKTAREARDIAWAEWAIEHGYDPDQIELPLSAGKLAFMAGWNARTRWDRS